MTPAHVMVEMQCGPFHERATQLRRFASDRRPAQRVAGVE